MGSRSAGDAATLKARKSGHLAPGRAHSDVSISPTKRSNSSLARVWSTTIPPGMWRKALDRGANRRPSLDRSNNLRQRTWVGRRDIRGFVLGSVTDLPLPRRTSDQGYAAHAVAPTDRPSSKFQIETSHRRVRAGQRQTRCSNPPRCDSTRARAHTVATRYRLALWSRSPPTDDLAPGKGEIATRRGPSSSREQTCACPGYLHSSRSEP